MEAINDWARRTSSSFGDSRADFARSHLPAPAPVPADLIYRLKHWPELPSVMRTAEVLRLLSLMSSRPVRRSWVLANTRLGEQRLDGLLKRLVQQDALDTIDLALLPAERPGT